MEISFPKSQIDYSLLQTQKLKFERGTRSKPIYHYTSIYGLEGVLKNKTLHFTNIKYMNDKDEIIAGIDSLSSDLSDFKEERESFLHIIENRKMQTFVCCFSNEKDSLPMWNYYTKEINNHGYNIEFDNKKLVESILRKNQALNGCNISFGDVDYSINNHSKYTKTINNKLNIILRLMLAKLEFWIAKNSYENGLLSYEESKTKELEEEIKKLEKKDTLRNLSVYFFEGEKCSFKKEVLEDYLYFIKRDSFKQENEFRIVISIPDELLPKLKEDGIYKFRISNGVLVPYIELKFSEEVVKGITISPTVQSDLVELSIQDFLKYCKYDVEDYSQFIKHSNIPVRF